MAIGDPVPADSGGTLGSPVFSPGITSNWSTHMAATGVSTADTLTNNDPDTDLTRNAVKDMTFNGNEGSMIRVGILYPSTMTASTTSAVIIAFGKDKNGVWERLPTAGGGNTATIATDPTVDVRSGSNRLALASYTECFLRNGCTAIRFATSTALVAGTGYTSATLVAKPVA